MYYNTSIKKQQNKPQRKGEKIMARERMVTRTINFTECETMVVNVETAEVSTRVLILTGIVAEKDMLKLLKKEYENSTEKVVAITSHRTTEQLYGMKEVDFMKYAVLMNDRFEKI